MENKTEILIIALILIAAGIALFYIKISNTENAQNNADSLLQEENKTQTNLTGNNSHGVSGAGGGSSSGAAEIPNELEINQSACGFYFAEYGTCGGKCPSGRCVSNGRSCYCQN